MNRIPPNLLYLTIYNPTLRPTGPVDDDNEDAEEQAHILFYTSKERAVSRDRMLRQIGLAKALVNFAELFNPDDPCDNVHSQSKRMIMVSPEPNFWIHAGIEIARLPRVADPKSKSKVKDKSLDTGKEKETAPIYDYEDGSVHDAALRAHILMGYERFKLIHGSFTSILATLGQQALELQLERFWTVWAWSWDLEERAEFGEYFGSPLHPCFSTLTPLVDDFQEKLSTGMTPVVLTRPYIIPSERFNAARYPSTLAVHLSTMIPQHLDTSQSSDTLNTLASSVDTIRAHRGAESNDNKPSFNKPNPNNGSGNFLGMPVVNMNMDMRKWNWPGYLTFGKGNSHKPPGERSSNPIPGKEKPETAANSDVTSQVEVQVNRDALEEAISCDSMSLASRAGNGSAKEDARVDKPSSVNESDPAPGNEQPSPEANQVVLESTKSPSVTFSDRPNSIRPPSPPLLPEFSMTKVHLAPFQDPTNTRRVAIHYHIRNGFMLALINMQDQADENHEAEAFDLQVAAEEAIKLFEDLESAIYDAGLKSLSESLPSATKILQTQDRYLISARQYMHSSPGFTSTSSHLFNAKAILDRDSEITEVFSRGQNPQHWHIGKRGLGVSPENEGDCSEEAVFMEVFRKEASLTDVDNVLTGLVKKSGLVDVIPALK